MSDGGDVLATIVAATTRGVEVRATPDARRALERAAAAWQPRGAALLAALRGAGRPIRDHRRVQAPLAVAGHPARRLRSGGDRARSTRRPARRRSRC